ncbi:hypothetical protein K435DRAFT_721077 [Dendrothele bispora CBS 962.96]|uniref:TRIP4/RQT4 C2HC5-type zinc finger domain-containing protein n=1 Tax=Dendrothele bispora (strain CBS 962.96) TaxID=1314807 RepID=A0A4S8M758_DENBC|nr:hypothetical protein K435DRAFT_721077 [Dendrothele bispora CBS 962.96]
MRQTPWTGSSLPSDRIKPSYSSKSNEKPRGKNATPSNEPPKSKDVRRLESLLSALRVSTVQTDPTGGCFCQAREHPLSSYSPICRSCGLVLCSLNQPSFSCPHCSSTLLAGNQRDIFISRIETQISDVLEKEAAERERILEEARRQAGAFPALSSNANILSNKSSQNLSINAPTPQPAAARKVMSLTGKGRKGKVVMSSYTPVSSRPASRSESEVEPVEEEQVRVPPPANQTDFSRRAPDAARPWANLRGGDTKYTPSRISRGKETKSRRNNKGKTDEGKQADS